MIGVLELILCDIGNTTYHFLVRDKHKKYFLDEEHKMVNDLMLKFKDNGRVYKKIYYFGYRYF